MAETEEDTSGPFVLELPGLGVDNREVFESRVDREDGFVLDILQERERLAGLCSRDAVIVGPC